MVEKALPETIECTLYEHSIVMNSCVKNKRPRFPYRMYFLNAPVNSAILCSASSFTVTFFMLST